MRDWDMRGRLCSADMEMSLWMTGPRASHQSGSLSRFVSLTNKVASSGRQSLDGVLFWRFPVSIWRFFDSGRQWASSQST